MVHVVLADICSDRDAGRPRLHGLQEHEASEVDGDDWCQCRGGILAVAVLPFRVARASPGLQRHGSYETSLE